jgi:outer membrane cobalamin receptor
MNMAVTKSIEVIKGPSSALYGSEAIGGCGEFYYRFTFRSTRLRASMQGNNIGYKRTDLLTSVSKGKWGFFWEATMLTKKMGPWTILTFTKAL